MTNHNIEDTINLLEQAADTLWESGYKGLARGLLDHADTLRPPPPKTKAPEPDPEDMRGIPTPRDLEDYLRREMRIEIGALRGEMRIEIDALRMEFRERFNALSKASEDAANELSGEIDALRTEVSNLKADAKVNSLLVSGAVAVAKDMAAKGKA